MRVREGAPSGHLDDETLVAEMVSGSHTAFETIFHRHVGIVHHLASCLVGDEGTADEVTQDVFLWLLDRPDRYDRASGTLGSFLLGRCRRRSLHVMRSDASRGDEVAGRTEERRQSRRSSEVGRPLERSRHEVDVVGRLSLLTETERVPLVLAYYGELSYREVANELRIPASTAKSRIRSGLGHLRQEMARLDLLAVPRSPGSTSPSGCR